MTFFKHHLISENVDICILNRACNNPLDWFEFWITLLNTITLVSLIITFRFGYYCDLCDFSLSCLEDVFAQKRWDIIRTKTSVFFPFFLDMFLWKSCSLFFFLLVSILIFFLFVCVCLQLLFCYFFNSPVTSPVFLFYNFCFLLLLFCLFPFFHDIFSIFFFSFICFCLISILSYFSVFCYFFLFVFFLAIFFLSSSIPLLYFLFFFFVF